MSAITGFHAEWTMYNGVEYAVDGSKTMKNYSSDVPFGGILHEAMEQSIAINKRLRSIYITPIVTTEKP